MELTAHLEELMIVTTEPLVIEVDFVLTNRAAEPISITERWNSWGAYHWSFQLTDADGTIVEYQNPQEFWTRNFFSLATIEPGKEHRTNCLLTFCQPQEHRTGINVFRSSKEVAGVAFPATLFGVFSISKKQSDGDRATNWEGTISTNPIKLTKTEQGAAPNP